MNNKQINVISRVLSLSNVVTDKIHFIIPSYQRPYVWSDDDIVKFFDDIRAGMNSKEDSYYIGTIVSSVKHDTTGRIVYELIDGQQRITTLLLWSIASINVIPDDLDINQVPVINDEPRLQFAIREPVQQLLGSLCRIDDYVFPGDQAIRSNPYLTRLYASFQILCSKLYQLSETERIEIAKYLYHKVQWVNNIVPSNTDLNALFTNTNTSGVQLASVDLLKAKIIKNIKSEKALYNSIWSSCAHMENFFERNVRSLFPLSKWDKIQPKSLFEWKDDIFLRCIDSDDNDSKSGLCIKQIASLILTSKSTNNYTQSTEADESSTTKIYCRSIISFSQLLIHTYRIFCAEKGIADIGPRLHTDRLIEIFSSFPIDNENEIKRFILLLWKVRYQFDRWIIKWLEHDDEPIEQLSLTNQSLGNSNGSLYITRNIRETNELSQLQSVRYFSGDRNAQYWLTPFLAYLVREPLCEEPQVLDKLEYIDNILSITDETETQKSASFKLAQGNNVNIVAWQNIQDYLLTPKGTAFEHYWFQKLEYILWKKRDRKDNKANNYRIASRNSVEHVYPQNEEYKNKISNKHLHSFGNLVLLSPGENSSYSNQAIGKKWIDFNNKNYYESLKLKNYFNQFGDNKHWEQLTIENFQQIIDEHLNEVIEILKDHYI